MDSRRPRRSKKFNEWMKVVIFFIGLGLVELYATFAPAAPPHK